MRGGAGRLAGGFGIFSENGYATAESERDRRGLPTASTESATEQNGHEVADGVQEEQENSNENTHIANKLKQKTSYNAEDSAVEHKKQNKIPSTQVPTMPTQNRWRPATKTLRNND